MNFIGLYVGARAFRKFANFNFINYKHFSELVTSGYIPARINQYCDESFIPTAEEIEKASLKTAIELKDETFFGNYNNLIFLNKKTKTHLRKNKKTDTNTNTNELNEEQILSELEFAKDGRHLIFNIFDKYRNRTLYFEEYQSFFKYSMIYT